MRSLAVVLLGGLLGAGSGCLLIDGLTGDGSGGDGSGYDGPAYVLVSKGSFTMGSPPGEAGRSSDETQHMVTLTRDFYLKATEVTQGEWRALMGDNPSSFGDCGDDCPVESVSWFQAVDYVNALSRSEGLEECYGGTGSERSFVGLDCRGYRLPTEAEWEYAARAGTLGARYGELDDIAWYGANASATQPVGRKAPNDWGLHDMLGNVWEWTHDWYGAYGGAATDPVGPARGSGRVSRGGGWDYVAALCRAAYRHRDHPVIRRSYLGFRPARSANP
jgi:formylglycine-generating enzyme required for sulfatase activity